MPNPRATVSAAADDEYRLQFIARMIASKLQHLPIQKACRSPLPFSTAPVSG
jgi:hypothetical protein